MLNGAGGEDRTRTALRPADFKSAASSGSATPADAQHTIEGGEPVARWSTWLPAGLPDPVLGWSLGHELTWCDCVRARSPRGPLVRNPHGDGDRRGALARPPRGAARGVAG